MHKLGRLIQELMDGEGMTRSELVRRSGMTRQHAHGLLSTDEMRRLPEVGTIQQLCRAFPHVPAATFVLAAAESAGLDVSTGGPDYAQLSDEALLGILADRLKGGRDVGTTH